MSAYQRRLLCLTLHIRGYPYASGDTHPHIRAGETHMSAYQRRPLWLQFRKDTCLQIMGDQYASTLGDSCVCKAEGTMSAHLQRSMYLQSGDTQRQLHIRSLDIRYQQSSLRKTASRKSASEKRQNNETNSRTMYVHIIIQVTNNSLAVELSVQFYHVMTDVFHILFGT